MLKNWESFIFFLILKLEELGHVDKEKKITSNKQKFTKKFSTGKK
jgi:mannitol/fructose-specific phosphotransferase system IIA component (Ntr-type)